MTQPERRFSTTQVQRKGISIVWSPALAVKTHWFTANALRFPASR
jgi:hypothetical protein